MPDGVASRFNQVDMQAQHERLLAGAALLPSGDLGARAGVRPGQTIVTVGGAPEAWTVAAHSGVIEGPADGDGSYVYAIPTAVSTNLPARPAAGLSRKDIIVARALDADVPATGSALREIDLQHIPSAESANPAAPAKPAGSTIVATLTVPAAGAITITPGQRTAALGGILPVASLAERNAISRIYDSLLVYREDTDVFEGRVNGAWKQLLLADDSGWTNVALNGAWTDAAAAGEPAPSFRRLNGVVYLRGRVTGGSATDNTLIFTLPAGSRPAVDLVDVPAMRGGSPADPWKATIRSNGRVEPRGLTANTSVSLNGISFPIG